MKGLSLEQRADRAERNFGKVIGHDVTGATSMLVTLRYLMGGGYPFFGHHGGAIIPFNDVMYTDRKFNRNYFHTPHEQIAGHAAEGFADSTGKVGIVVVTSGPGIMNLATACYDAMMDSVPVLYIAGDVLQTVSGSMAFQEAPVRGVFHDISKNVFYVTSAKDIPRVLFEAYKLAKSGRPGPVVVDIPKDVQLQRAKFYLERDPEPKVDGYMSFDAATLTKLSGQIASAKRPVLYVGGGVKSAEAWDELRELVDRTKIPVTYTLKGKGVFPDTNKHSLGPLGMHGSVAANYAVDNADLLIAIGARFDDRVTGDPNRFAPNAYIAHFDVDPRGIGPKGARQPQMVVKGDVKGSLRALNDLLTTPPDLREWRLQIDGWKAEFPFSYRQEGSAIKPQYAIQTLGDLLKDISKEVIYVTDVGQHQMWAMQYLSTSNPRGFLTSGGAGTMGYGLPAAMGAKLGNPDKTVVLVTGDASFRMTSQTLELYSALGLDIKVMVIDNSSPDRPSGGMVHQWLGRGPRPARLKVRGSSKITSIASGYGIPAYDVKDIGKVPESMELALKTKGPYILNIRVDPNEDVYPFIPSGKSVAEIELGPARGKRQQPVS